MANNNIELITKYSTDAWDEVYKAEAISSLFDAPSAQVKWTGAKTVKIAKFQATGLGNYYRNNGTSEYDLTGTHLGYAGGQVGLTWEEFTVKQDRSAKYPIELFDDEETNGLILGAATKEISRTIMVPEVDAYCFSTVYDYAAKQTTTTASAADTNAMGLLNDGLLYLEEHEIPAEKQVIVVAPRFMKSLRATSMELSRLLQADYNKDVKFTMTKFEGRDLVVCPPNRFRTNIQLKNDGYAWAEDSKHIAFMIINKDAINHVVKYNKVKIISGDLNLAGQGFDGSTLFARIYHDVFVTDNKRYSIYAATYSDYTTAINTPEIMGAPVVETLPAVAKDASKTAKGARVDGDEA